MNPFEAWLFNEISLLDLLEEFQAAPVEPTPERTKEDGR